MACFYKRRKRYWISYYTEGKQIQKTLHTSNERIALAKKKQSEYQLSLGELHAVSQLHVPEILEAFCKRINATRTCKSYKNDISRLRTFLGPVYELLKPSPPGIKRGHKSSKSVKDKYAGVHVQAAYLEDISPEVINRFLSDRIKLNGWVPKTANLMRQILHELFAYAIKHYGFRSPGSRYSNPVACVDRLREPAPEITFLSFEQITEQLKALKNHPVIYVMVATYIYAGLRREEALWLTNDDVDLQARLIRIKAKTVNGE